MRPEISSDNLIVMFCELQSYPIKVVVPLDLLGHKRVVNRVVHIMLSVSHYYAYSLCSTNITTMLK